MPALIVNFDEVLFRTGGASPRPDAIRLIKDADASGWQIALTSELTQDTVRERLAPFLPDLAASALVAGREYAVEEAPNTIDFAAGKLREMPEQILVLECGEAGFLRANDAELANVIVMHTLPDASDLQRTQLIVDRFGLPDDEKPITALADPRGIDPHPLVTVEHLHACLLPFKRRMNEFAMIRPDDE